MRKSSWSPNDVTDEDALAYQRPAFDLLRVDPRIRIADDLDHATVSDAVLAVVIATQQLYGPFPNPKALADATIGTLAEMLHQTGDLTVLDTDGNLVPGTTVHAVLAGLLHGAENGSSGDLRAGSQRMFASVEYLLAECTLTVGDGTVTLGKYTAPTATGAAMQEAGAPAGSTAGTGATQTRQASTRTVEELLGDLDRLVGLTGVKATIRRETAVQQVSALRTARGLPTHTGSRHMVFTGNPGTGKTTVARMVADIYHKLGVLSKGHLVEVGPAGLMGKFQGQNAQNALEVIQSARGGVLLVDEAYSLAGTDRGPIEFAKEVIDVLVKALEDYRDDLIVIFTGYSEPMQRFLDTNPGMRSRVGEVIEFPDYTVDELAQVLDVMTSESGYCVEPAARAAFLAAMSTRDRSGNARTVRNILDDAVAAAAVRVTAGPSTEMTDDDLSRITVMDMMDALARVKADPQKVRAIGFTPTAA